jgi:uncharacterized membrane protein
MSAAHLTNLVLHVVAGSIALVIGFTMLENVKGTAAHRRWGRIFCYFTIVVCCSAALGSV